MASDVSAQLDGLAGVMERSVRTAVLDEYALRVVDGVISTLNVLAQGIDRLNEFELWDESRSAELLQTIQDEIGPLPAAGHMDAELHTEGGHDSRHRLAEVVGRVPVGSRTHADIVAHLIARAKRHPFRTTNHLPRKEG